MHNITLDTLHYVTLHYVTLHYITSHYITLHMCIYIYSLNSRPRHRGGRDDGGGGLSFGSRGCGGSAPRAGGRDGVAMGGVSTRSSLRIPHDKPMDFWIPSSKLT